MPYAQTHLALLGQLRKLGYGAGDLDRIRRAYGLAMRLFTGHFRPNGVPFLTHLVRTASVLADTGALPDAVIAALLHAAYTHGEFGDGRRGVTEAKRARLRAAVGDASEDLIRAYTETGWPELLLTAAGGVDALSHRDRTILLIRLANELEDYLDVDAGGSPKLELATASAMLGDCVRVAASMDQPGLRSAFAQACEQLRRTAVQAPASAPAMTWAPPEAALYAGPRGSFLLAPRSHRPRALLSLRQFVRGSTAPAALYRAGRALFERLRGSHTRTR
ncbi:MAG: DUF6817 domain-containing protein [Candidatus Binatia bacterium]